ncbi:MAG: hypothetical protein RIR89_620 [Actinomycetota bacterium]|jgi:hypothetical protein
MSEQKDELLADRYGQRPANPKVFRIFAYLALATFTIGTIALGLANWNPIQSTTVGFRVVSPWVTEVDFEIQMPPGQVAECSIEALNNSFAVVGHITQTFGPFDQLITNHTVAVNTYEEAVSGLVDSCTLR